MRALHYDLKQLCHRNPDGSFTTQANRERMATRVANDIERLGFRDLDYHNLRERHVEALVDDWIGRGLSPGTIKNLMSFMRWWAEKIGKPNVIARSNDEYGIPDRKYVTNLSKAKELDMDKLQRIDSVYIAYMKISLRLQAGFGFRWETSVKIHPGRGDHLHLEPSWTKGGRPQDIPIRTAEQRRLVDEAKAVAKGGSLIPRDFARYVDYLYHFRYRCGRAGIHGFHGHRHWYAQERYRELTGWECPVRGGPVSKQLTREQKVIDMKARLVISHEMGHGREQITAVYLGR